MCSSFWCVHSFVRLLHNVNASNKCGRRNHKHKTASSFSSSSKCLWVAHNWTFEIVVSTWKFKEFTVCVRVCLYVHCSKSIASNIFQILRKEFPILWFVYIPCFFSRCNHFVLIFELSLDWKFCFKQMKLLRFILDACTKQQNWMPELAG